MTHAFGRDTAVLPAGPGCWTADLPGEWDLRPLPQGGVVTAIALRAMEAELDDPSQRLRVLHTTFAAQVRSGPMEIEVEALRRGRTMSHLRAEVRNPEAARGHLTTGIFGVEREGFRFTDLAPPPDVPLPADCPSFRDPPPPEAPVFEPMPFWVERLEGRPALGNAMWEEGVPRDRAERAVWHRFDETPWRDDGALDPYALVVMADMMPGAVGQKVGPSDRMWFSPSVDLTFHLLNDCRSEWVLCHNTCRHAGDGYASADMALWDCGPEGADVPRLVAYATQVCLFSFTD